MGTKVLVIGATSKVGEEVVRRLAASGESVRAATRRPGEYFPPAGVEEVGFDYDERGSFDPALDGVDRVFMLSKWSDPHPEMALNRFIERALRAGVTHVVLLDSLAIDPTSSTPLGIVEKRVAETGMTYTILHPNWLMQNFARGVFLPGIRDVNSLSAPAGAGAVSFVDARDVAEVAVSALTSDAHAGQTYDLTGGEALTYAQVAGVLSDVTERGIDYTDPTEDAAQSLLHYHDWQADDVARVLELFKFVREGRSAAVSDTLSRALGRAPTTFEQFARDYASVWG